MGEKRAGADRRMAGVWLLWHRLLGHPRTALPLTVEGPRVAEVARLVNSGALLAAPGIAFAAPARP
ncbi:hypothetical protein TM233_16770 [Bradyrhizobium sp. TM233]|nr:hypothetical protein TM233_16770 [Bradyrhizobium sp. TM233]